MTTLAADFDPFVRQGIRGSEAPQPEATPLAWSEAASAWVATRYCDAVAILDDPTFVAFDMHLALTRIEDRARVSFPHLRAFLKASLIFNGGKDHASLRRLLSRTLGSQSLSALAPFMHETAQALWADGRERGSLDIVTAYAEPLPSIVIARLLGLSSADRRAFVRATYGLMGVYNRGCSIADYRAFNSRLAALRPTIDALFTSRRHAPRDDALTQFVMMAECMGLSTDAAAANLIFLYLAGVDQTSAMIALAIRTLLLDQTRMEALRRSRGVQKALIEELLRLESPAPQVIRVAGTDRDVGGILVRRGDPVIVLLANANRDFVRSSSDSAPDPDAKPFAHLAFARGAHACIGATLARVELLAALEPLRKELAVQIETTSVDWWELDATRRMRSFIISFPRAEDACS